jgi:hypothetical protein
VPTLLQVQNFVKRERKKRVPPTPLTDALLNAYIEEKSAIPVDMDAPYVIGSMPYANGTFLIVWTTPKLSAIQTASEFLATDATYCLTW